MSIELAPAIRGSASADSKRLNPLFVVLRSLSLFSLGLFIGSLSIGSGFDLFVDFEFSFSRFGSRRDGSVFELLLFDFSSTSTV